MGKVAFSLSGAARAASVKERDIEVAVHRGELVARTIGKEVVILNTDLHDWVESQPAWSA